MTTKRITLRHTISGVSDSFAEDYALDLLADPELGQVLEIVDEEAPCLDCPSDEPVQDAEGDWDPEAYDSPEEQASDIEAYEKFVAADDAAHEKKD